MDDIDPARPDQVRQLAPDARVERMAFGDLDVVDVQFGGPPIQVEHRIAQVTDVADRHGEPGGVAAGGSEENRLLGATAGTANAPKFEDSDGDCLSHSGVPVTENREASTNCRDQAQDIEHVTFSKWSPSGRLFDRGAETFVALAGYLALGYGSKLF